jgi:predicted  nucleic acid-binding Zn-ribbon protein
MNWIKDNLIMVLAGALVAAVLASGVQSYRLAAVKADFAEARAEWSAQVAESSEQARMASESYRALETKMNTRQQEIANEHANQIRARDSDLAAARQRLDSLRHAIAAAESRQPADPTQASAQPDAPATGTGALLGACAERYAELGNEADRLSDQVRGLQSHVVSLSCQAP